VEFPESTGILNIPALILGKKDAGRNPENGTKLQVPGLIAILWNLWPDAWLASILNHCQFYIAFSM